MELIATYTHKNVTCEIYASKISEVYITGGGDFVTGDVTDRARKGAVDYYNSPRNNKRSKKTTVLKEVLAPSNKSSMQRQINNDNRWLDGELKSKGFASSGGVLTMLKNKGY